MEKLLLVRLSEDFYNKMAEASPFPSTVKARAMFLPELDTFVGTKKQIEEKEKELYGKVDAEMNRQREVFRSNQANASTQLQTDLEEYHEVAGHPKAGLLFAKAWEWGHASGYAEVASVYADLVDFIK